MRATVHYGVGCVGALDEKVSGDETKLGRGVAQLAENWMYDNIPPRVLGTRPVCG